ncbi:NCS1 family nucleobase:cation symporter-1 [Salinisphaera hydrothermalis]|uniref:NCS1 family nucleobase:cation symporter-1 n=1 Tax=Salinisphaera hydrothermalis TaxID=563188 RepID=UPI00333E6BE8
MSSPVFPHPRLYNNDIAPVQREGRHWNAYNVFTMWANDVHSLGNYTFAIGLFALGLGAWQILLTFAIGAAILFALLTLSGFLGEQTGLPFPVVSRIAFGIRGGRVSAICRGGIAIVWFGIQTYLAANVLNALLVSFIPSLGGLEQVSFLGLSALGWASFVALWAIQIVIVSYGMTMVRHYIAFAGPIILVTMLAIAGWVLIRAHFTIAWSINQPLTGVPMWEMIFAGACLWVVIYGTFALNVCDFTRCVGTKRAVVLGNFSGILVNMMLFALIVIVLAGAQFQINGAIIKSPADIVRTIDSPIWRIAASLSLIVLTIAVNLVANFVAPNYMLCDLFPRWLTFRRAGLVTAIIGLVILPWNLYNSPLVINYFLGGLGAILGPFFGLIMVDYWVIRRQRINIPDLYSESPDGTYYYRDGFNPRAFYALVPAAVISIAVALIPVFHAISDFSWIVGAVIAGVLHLTLAPKDRAYQHVEGEAIARPSQ